MPFAAIRFPRNFRGSAAFGAVSDLWLKCVNRIVLTHTQPFEFRLRGLNRLKTFRHVEAVPHPVGPIDVLHLMVEQAITNETQAVPSSG